MVQLSGATESWSPAGARPGALHRTGDALARRKGQKSNDRFEPFSTSMTTHAPDAVQPVPMSADENQILIPPSFEAVHRDARGRLTLPRDDFRARYELCEDMAQMLVEPCQARHHDQGVSEDLVLARTRAGLESPDSGFSVAESLWVVTRLAELLGWAMPDGPPECL